MLVSFWNSYYLIFLMFFCKSTSRQFFVSLGALVIASQSVLFSADKNPGGIDFTRDIRPLLSDNCFACHGPDSEDRQAGLRLDDRESALQELDSGMRAIVPGKPTESELVGRILDSDPDVIMPPPESNHVLTKKQKEIL